MRYVLFLALFCLALPLQIARGQTSAASPVSLLTGHDLYQLCTSSSNLDYGMCAGYVTAVANMLSAGPVAGRSACNFSLVRNQQFMDLVTAHIEHNPQTQSRPAYEAAAQALSQAFRCQ